MMTKQSKQIKSIADINKEMSHLDKKFNSIYRNMLAVALDYKFYIDSRFVKDKIYDIRDSIIYRLNSSKFHFELLLNIIMNLDTELTKIYRTQDKNSHFPILHSYFENRVLQINYLSDSIFFHITSCFDYISNLVEFICINKKNANFKWTQLTRSANDVNNPFSNISVSNTVIKINREFVSKLYNYRSDIIHKNVYKGPSSLSINIKQAECKTYIFSSDSFNKKFKELKKESKYFNFTIQYALLWVIKESISCLNEILFALKYYMENNIKEKSPFIFLKGPNGEIISPSKGFWKEKNGC